MNEFLFCTVSCAGGGWVLMGCLEIMARFSVLRKLSKFSFPNCQNFPFQTVKIFPPKFKKSRHFWITSWKCTNTQQPIRNSIPVCSFPAVKTVIIFAKGSSFYSILSRSKKHFILLWKNLFKMFPEFFQNSTRMMVV